MLDLDNSYKVFDASGPWFLFDSRTLFRNHAFLSPHLTQAFLISLQTSQVFLLCPPPRPPPAFTGNLSESMQ